MWAAPPRFRLSLSLSLSCPPPPPRPPRPCAPPHPRPHPYPPASNPWAGELTREMVARLSGAGGGDGLPKHYVEVGKLLLGRAGGDFGSEAYQVKSLLEEIRVVRFRKAQDGMKVLIDNFSEEQAGIDVSDFSMMEMNLVREFLLGSLDKIHKLWWGKRGSGEGEGSGGGGTQEPGASAALAEEPEENGQERRRQLR